MSGFHVKALALKRSKLIVPVYFFFFFEKPFGILLWIRVRQWCIHLALRKPPCSSVDRKYESK